MARMKTPSALPLWLLVGLGPVACVSQVLPESTTTPIGQSGGTASSADGLFSLIVPPGALPAEVAITIETDRSSPLPDQLGARYRVLPTDLRFAVPATARRRVGGRWIGELSLGSPTRASLPGAVFDTEAEHFDVLLLSVGCAERRCTSEAQCAGEGRCRVFCTSDCTNTYECERPADCMGDGEACPTVRQACANSKCVGRDSLALVSLAELLASQPATRATEAAVTCASDTFVLYVHTRADACAARVCGESCVSCDPSSPSCRHAAGACGFSGACEAAPSCSAPATPDGWDAPPGSGLTFVMSHLAISGPHRGFDVDGRCDGPSGECVDNAMWPVGTFVNDQIRQGLLGGESLMLVEIAGVELPYTGDDDSVTIKLYGARDGDDPFFPANNFSIPAGDTKCCEFKLSPQSLDSTLVQARTRIPGRIRGGWLSTHGSADVTWVLNVGVPPHPTVQIRRARLTASLSRDLVRLDDVILGGALAPSSIMQSLFSSDDPEAARQHSLLDTIAFGLPLDIDVDMDGLETVTATEGGYVQGCFDGCGTNCPIRPTNLEEPWTCVSTPELADGFSISLDISGVRASVVGVGN
jgi:hypothetical protein